MVLREFSIDFQQAGILLTDVEADAPMKLAQAHGTQMQIIRLVLHLLAITTAHEAVVPRAVLEAEHVPNLMQQSFHRSVQQLRTEPRLEICFQSGRERATFRSVTHEAEDANTLGQPR
mmetsp:Transcript_58792/g.105227  ORF Transcript_58792/g.105227 Transcript_58792/m.105227 type:complete len:118 (-) Transcript_58792:297-650(-)